MALLCPPAPVSPRTEAGHWRQETDSFFHKSFITFCTLNTETVWDYLQCLCVNSVHITAENSRARGYEVVIICLTLHSFPSRNLSAQTLAKHHNLNGSRPRRKNPNTPNCWEKECPILYSSTTCQGLLTLIRCLFVLLSVFVFSSLSFDSWESDWCRFMLRRENQSTVIGEPLNTSVNQIDIISKAIIMSYCI